MLAFLDEKTDITLCMLNMKGHKDTRLEKPHVKLVIFSFGFSMN